MIFLYALNSIFQISSICFASDLKKEKKKKKDEKKAKMKELDEKTLTHFFYKQFKIINFLNSLSKCNMPIFLIIFVLNITLSNCELFAIPDQHAFINKLFYYQLPLNEPQLTSISKIDIKEVDSDPLPVWLMFKKSLNKFELIGLPQPEHKRLYFLLVEVIQTDNTQFDDVFVLDVTDDTSPNSLLELTQSSKVCSIFISDTFPLISDVWDVIYYLMPNSMKQKIDNRIKSFQDNSFDESDDDVDFNFKIQKWARLYFSITSTPKSNYVLSYQIKINHQDCNKHEKFTRNDFEYKLKYLGLEYSLIKEIKPFSNLEVNRSDDDMLQAFQELGKNHVADSTNVHRRRHLDHTHPHPHHHQATTPVVNSDWVTLTVTTVQRGFKESSKDSMIRIVPSLISPTLSSHFIDEINPTTPHIPDHVRYENRFQTPFISSTPILIPEPPTHFLVFTPSSILTDTTNTSEEPLVSRTIVFISPSPTVAISSQSSTVLNETTSTTTESSLSSHTLTPNKVPIIQNRIPKLAITAGKYWQYVIPFDTFYDPEDGYSLKLGFYLNDKKHPSKDYWIQFDSENRWLFAFPTDDEIGVHTFFLEAIDSSGLTIIEEIEIYVRQHKSSRRFHYKITFLKVQWDSLKFYGMVEALKNLATRVSRLYGDKSIDHFIIQKCRSETVREKKYWTITFTNDSLPAYPCPQKLINQLFTKLIDTSKPTEDTYSKPSFQLDKIGGSFKIEGVSIFFSETCTKLDQVSMSQDKPILRNPIDKIEFNLGQVFKYKIPSDTFYAPHGKNTYDLDLNVYTIDGFVLNNNDFVKFNESSFELIGLAVDRKYLKDNEFILVAKDKFNGLDENDAFVITISEPVSHNKHTFEIVLGLSIKTGDIDLDTKLDIANKISTQLFDDDDTRFLTILKIIKSQYIIPLNQNQHLEENEINSKEFISKMTQTPQSYYKIVWTNSSDALLFYNNKCPSHAIRESIHKKLFGGNYGFSEIEKKFGLKYKLIFVSFNTTERCLNYLSPNVIYKDNLKPIFLTSKSDEEIEVYSIPKSDQDLEMIDNEIDEQDITEYYIKTIVPAMITILIMLLFSFILLCILIRYRKNNRKRCDLLTQNNSSKIRSSFITKGQKPVVFEADLQQHLLSQSPNLVMLPSNSSHQNLPLKSLNKSSPYQPLVSRSSEQRRQPPPYVNK